MVKGLVNLILSITLGIFVLFSVNIKDAYYRSEIGSNVVRVFNTEMTSGGTGFHIKTDSGKVYILTNKHVCELADDKDQVLVEQNENKEIRKVVARYKHHDLCLVEPLKEHENSISISKDLEVGEDIITVGHPGLRNLTLAHGEYIGKVVVNLMKLVNSELECPGGVIKVDPIASMLFGKLVCIESFQSSAISSPIYGGNSGSPVINKWGKVVGVVFAGNRGQPNDGYMVPLRFVKDFLKGR